MWLLAAERGRSGWHSISGLPDLSNVHFLERGPPRPRKQQRAQGRPGGKHARANGEDRQRVGSAEAVHRRRTLTAARPGDRALLAKVEANPGIGFEMSWLLETLTEQPPPGGQGWPCHLDARAISTGEGTY